MNWRNTGCWPSAWAWSSSWSGGPKACWPTVTLQSCCTPNAAPDSNRPIWRRGNDRDQRNPAARSRAPDHAVRRAGRRQRRVVHGDEAADHGGHRPQWRRQDHDVQLPDRLLFPHRRQAGPPPGRRGLPAGAAGSLPHLSAGRRRAHLPEHPPVRPYERAGKPHRRPAQQADEGVRLHGRGIAWASRLPQGGEAGGRTGPALAGQGAS